MLTSMLGWIGHEHGPCQPFRKQSLISFSFVHGDRKSVPRSRIFLVITFPFPFGQLHGED